VIHRYVSTGPNRELTIRFDTFTSRSVASPGFGAMGARNRDAKNVGAMGNSFPGQLDDV